MFITSKLDQRLKQKFDGPEIFNSDVSAAIYDAVPLTFHVHTGFHQISLLVDFYPTKIQSRKLKNLIIFCSYLF